MGSRKLVPQLLVAFSASLGYMTIGLVRGFSSPGVPSMVKVSPHLVPTEEAISWVSAIPPLGAMIGSLAVAPLLQRCGRKRSLLVAAPVFACAWLLIAFASTTAVLIGARVLSGFCAGLVIPSAQVYVSESAHAKTRGILGSLPALFMAIGVLISYVLGTWLPWNQLAMASAVFPALLFVSLLPLPESPAWLLSHGRVLEAKASLTWLHRPADVIAIELNVIEVPNGKGSTSVKPAYPRKPLPDGEPYLERMTTLEDSDGPRRSRTFSLKEELELSPDNEIMDIAVSERRKSVAMQRPTEGDLSLKAFFRKPVLYPFGLAIALLGFQQVSGIDTIIFYTVDIFRATDSDLNEYLATIIVGVVQLVCTLLSLLGIDRAGRRPLLLLSGAVMTAAMTAMGLYFFLQARGQAGVLGLLPVSALLLFMVGFSLGYANIPFLLMGELLPVRQRSVLSSLCGSFNLGAMFLVIKTYPEMKLALGPAVTFWMYALLCLLSCLFVWFLLPETKGKTLEEIERFFEGRHKDQESDSVRTAQCQH